MYLLNHFVLNGTLECFYLLKETKSAFRQPLNPACPVNVPLVAPVASLPLNMTAADLRQPFSFLPFPLLVPPSTCSPHWMKLPGKWSVLLKTNEEKWSFRRTVYRNLIWHKWISDLIHLLGQKQVMQRDGESPRAFHQLLNDEFGYTNRNMSERSTPVFLLKEFQGKGQSLSTFRAHLAPN